MVRKVTISPDGTGLALTAKTKISLVSGLVAGGEACNPLDGPAEYLTIRSDIAITVKLDGGEELYVIGASQTFEFENLSVKEIDVEFAAGATATLYIFASIDSKMRFRRVI